MNDQAIRFRFGIFVGASLVLLAVLTILFGGIPTMFKRMQSYTIVFANAAGLSPGAPVRRSGVRIGEVRDISLDNETGKVHVDIEVEDRFSLRKVDRPTIVVGLIGGDAAITFLPPQGKEKEDMTMIAPGSVIEGVSPPDPGSMLSGAESLVMPAKEALEKIKVVFEGLDKMRPTVDATLDSFRLIGKMTQEVGPDVKKAAEEISALAKSTREMLPEIRKTNDEMQFTVRTWGRVGERVDVLLKTNEDKINRSVDRLEDTMRRINLVLADENIRNVNDTLKNLRSATGQLDALATDTRDLIKDSRVTIKQMNESLKNADAFMADAQKAMKPFADRGPTILKNFEDTSTNLNHTLTDVRELIRFVARSDGTINKLIADPSLYNHLNDAAESLSRIMPRVDRTMHDLETFADKLARHPELLGLRGAVFPSSGLKDTSTPTRTYHIYPWH